MSNKNAVISGASGDIGISLAHAFYNENYDLVLLYNRNKKSIDDFINAHNSKDIKILPLNCLLYTSDAADE